jgi:hypothetical protein
MVKKCTNRQLFKRIAVICLSVLGFMRLDAATSTLVVTPNLNANQLVQNLQGPGVSYSGATLTCGGTAAGASPTAAAAGLFTYIPDASMPYTSGVVLASGRLTGSSGTPSYPDLANPATVTFSSPVTPNTNDAQLNALTGTSSNNDACVLQFDFIPLGDSLSFHYEFGSEEYTGFICTQYNDAFGFFITGPNPAGAPYSNKNIALVPGTNTPVSINTVHPNSYGDNTSTGKCSISPYSHYQQY